MARIQGVKTIGLMDAIRSAHPGKGEFALFWLGQAGFVIKTETGHTIGIDPCLSDYCEKNGGFKRLIPSVCLPEEFACDTLLISHEHDDHFDVDLINTMAQKGNLSRLLGPVSIDPLIKAHGLEPYAARLEYGRAVSLPGVEITAVFSDHGADTPHALGFLFDFGTVRLYYAGDTAYSPDLLGAAFAARPDIAIMPINGEFGNLDAAQAYRLAGEMGCRAMIPCHYWMYAQHGSRPLELMHAAKAQPGPEVIWLSLGEGWVGPAKTGTPDDDGDGGEWQ